MAGWLNPAAKISLLGTQNKRPFFSSSKSALVQTRQCCLAFVCGARAKIVVHVEEVMSTFQ